MDSFINYTFILIQLHPCSSRVVLTPLMKSKVLHVWSNDHLGSHIGFRLQGQIGPDVPKASLRIFSPVYFDCTQSNDTC